MKRITKLISLLLALVMLFSITAVQAFAATDKTVKQYGTVDKDGYGGYLAFDDSYSRGMGATLDYKERGEYLNFDCRNVTGAYPYLVAQAVGCCTPATITDLTGNYWPMCYPGQTLAATMDLMGIEDNYDDIEYALNHKVYTRYEDQLLPYYRGPQSVGGDEKDGKVGNIVEIAKKASLISVELGMGDIFYRPYRIMEKSGILSDKSLSTVERYAKFASRIIEEAYEGYAYWSEYYPIFIKELQKLNPTADIVIIGTFNPVAGVEITDDLLLPVGTAFSAITELMNQKYKAWAKELHVTYVDISNVETYSTQYDWSALGKLKDDVDLATHPTGESYAYIARQILSALPEAEPVAKPATASTDIVVDLGRFDKLDYVMLNGIILKESQYRLDGYVLTIPHKTRLAFSLTIAIVGADQKLAVQTYWLSYNHGYTASRLYGTNDLVSTVTKPVKNLISIPTSIFTSLGNLFKK